MKEITTSEMLSIIGGIKPKYNIDDAVCFYNQMTQTFIVSKITAIIIPLTKKGKLKEDYQISLIR